MSRSEEEIGNRENKKNSDRVTFERGALSLSTSQPRPPLLTFSLAPQNREHAQDPEVKYAGEIFYATVVRIFFILVSFRFFERLRAPALFSLSFLIASPLSFPPFLDLNSPPPPFFSAGPVPHPVDAGLVEEDAPALLRAGVAAGAVAGPGGDLRKVK